MERKIALAIIAGDEAIEEGLPAMIESVKGKVHGVFVAFTGDPALDAYVQIAQAISADDFSEGSVVPVDWEDDFSLARNLSFALVHEHEDRHPGTTFDYIFWLDCDDILPAEVDLQAAIRAMEKKHTHSGFMKYNYATDASGAVTGSHMKERLFRADVDWEWTFPIHENCHGPIASRGIRLKQDSFYVDHHRYMGGADKRQRNRRIIAHWYNQDRSNPRAIMYMAHEIFAEAEDEGNHKKKYDLYLACLKLYQEFVRISPISDETYDCNIQVGRALVQIARFNDAINVYLQCVKQNPNNPTSYCGIAEAYFAMEDYENVIPWCQNARAIAKVTSTFGVTEPLDVSYRPYMMEAGALRKLGRWDEALFIYLSEIEPPHAGSPFVHEQAANAQAEWDLALGKKTVDPNVQHELNWGRDADRSVAFFLPPHYEAWNPDTFKSGGLGGTETCVMELAKALVADDRRVVIYGEPGEDWNGHIKDGIEWYHSSMFHPDQPFDTVISVRIPAIFDANVNARQKIIWLHDVNVGPVRFEDGYDRFSQVDVIVTPSKFAAEHTKLVYGDKKDPFRAPVVPISNGLHVGDFAIRPFEADVRDPNRFIYASSPDRGLDRLLDLWPAIREMYPKAWLEIYYGWDAIDRIIEQGLPQAGQLSYFKDRIINKMAALGGKEGGIFWRGRVNHVTLAKAMKASNLLLYPSDFCVVGDTPIDCPRDHERFPDGVPVSMIEPGRLIWTINEVTQKFELKPITRVWKSKINAAVLKLTLDSGKTIRATADHRFMRRDGSWAELRELRPGDSLMPLYRDAEPLIKLDPNKRAGWSTEYRDVAKHLFGDRKGRHTHHVDERHFNNEPTNLQDLSPEDHFSLTHKGKKHGSSTRANMSAAQKDRFAAMTDEERREWVSRTDGCDRSAAANKAHETKRRKHEELIAAGNPFHNHKVVSIEPDGYEDVWDMEVEGNHNFVSNGVVLHNCETFGIVFAQAALAGCIPIVSNLGALSGQDHVITVDGPPNSDSFGSNFLEMVQEMYDAPHEYRCHISDRAKEFDWPEIAREWIDLVNTPTGVTVR